MLWYGIWQNVQNIYKIITKIPSQLQKNRSRIQVCLWMDYYMLQIFYFWRRINTEACSWPSSQDFLEWHTGKKCKPVEVLTHCTRVCYIPSKGLPCIKREQTTPRDQGHLKHCFETVLLSCHTETQTKLLPCLFTKMDVICLILRADNCFYLQDIQLKPRVR